MKEIRNISAARNIMTKDLSNLMSLNGIGGINCSAAFFTLFLFLFHRFTALGAVASTLFQQISEQRTAAEPIKETATQAQMIRLSMVILLFVRDYKRM